MSSWPSWWKSFLWSPRPSILISPEWEPRAPTPQGAQALLGQGSGPCVRPEPHHLASVLAFHGQVPEPLRAASVSPGAKGDCEHYGLSAFPEA